MGAFSWAHFQYNEGKPHSVELEPVQERTKDSFLKRLKFTIPIELMDDKYLLRFYLVEVIDFFSSIVFSPVSSYTKNMQTYVNLPFVLLSFFFVELPAEVIAYFVSLNDTVLQVFSIPLIIHTFFRPWKNEYRTKFIPMAIAIGFVIKFFILVATGLIYLALIIVEFTIVVLIIAWPIGTLLLLFL